MEYSALLKDLRSHKIDPIYLFWGDEDYLLEETMRELMQQVVEPEAIDFNLDIFYSNEVDSSRVMQAVTAYPVIATRRLVIIKDLERMRAQCLEAIGRYAQKPAKTTCLILAGGKLNFKTKGMQGLKKAATAVEFKPLYDNQIPAWIKNFLAAKRLEISEEALRILHENVGNALRELANELEKVMLNLAGRRKIEANDIRTVVGLSREFSVFELSNFIGHKNLKAAWLTLARMLELGEPPIKILTMLTRHFSILLKIKHGLKSGQSNAQLAATAGVSPYFMEDYLNQVKNFSMEQLTQAFSHLLQADTGLKSSSQKPQLILELALFHLIKH